MENKMEIRVKSIAELGIVAAEVIRLLEDHPVAAFHGPMGAGKTTLISEICRQLGVSDAVASPTFALVNQYAAADGRTIYHFDFYRIERPEEALDFGVEEYLDSGSMCLIEWPEKIGGLLPEDLLVVSITPCEEGGECRSIAIRTP